MGQEHTCRYGSTARSPNGAAGTSMSGSNRGHTRHRHERGELVVGAGDGAVARVGRHLRVGRARAAGVQLQGLLHNAPAHGKGVMTQRAKTGFVDAVPVYSTSDSSKMRLCMAAE